LLFSLSFAHPSKNLSTSSSSSPLPTTNKNLHPQLTYSTFIHGLKEENISLNRKILSDFAEKEPLTFGALARRVLERQQQQRSASSAKP